MSFLNYLWDRMLSILFNIVGMIAIVFIVGLTANLLMACIIGVGWVLFVAMYYTVCYRIFIRKRGEIKRIVDDTKDKFLLSELIDEPQRHIDRLYYECMLFVGRAAIEKVTELREEQAEYCDYIQEWIHEIKTPITAILLMCGNSDNEDFAEIARQVAKIDDCTEQVLYAAKSNSTDKDLLIRKTDLARVVNEVVKDNKRFFIDARANIITELSGSIYTDEKLFKFIIKQLLQNSVQYAQEESVSISLRSERLSEEKTAIYVRDNGIGILESDLPRIFEKGFTGTNGRKNKKSTGMGLYLCRKLCLAMDIPISVTSSVGEYTEFALVFNGSEQPY